MSAIIDAFWAYIRLYMWKNWCKLLPQQWNLNSTTRGQHDWHSRAFASFATFWHVSVVFFKKRPQNYPWIKFSRNLFLVIGIDQMDLIWMVFLRSRSNWGWNFAPVFWVQLRWLMQCPAWKWLKRVVPCCDVFEPLVLVYYVWNMEI